MTLIITLHSLSTLIENIAANLEHQFQEQFILYFVNILCPKKILIWMVSWMVTLKLGNPHVKQFKSILKLVGCVCVCVSVLIAQSCLILRPHGW